jgi:hypothetical protein
MALARKFGPVGGELAGSTARFLTARQRASIPTARNLPERMAK